DEALLRTRPPGAVRGLAAPVHDPDPHDLVRHQPAARHHLRRHLAGRRPGGLLRSGRLLPRGQRPDPVGPCRRVRRVEGDSVGRQDVSWMTDQIAYLTSTPAGGGRPRAAFACWFNTAGPISNPTPGDNPQWIAAAKAASQQWYVDYNTFVL